MGSSQSSYATNNNDINSSINKKNWSSKSRSVRGRKSINTNNNKNSSKIGSAPHGLRSSIVSAPSEPLDHHHLDITSVESVHSDDIGDVQQFSKDSYDTETFSVHCSDDDDDDTSVSTDDGKSQIFVHSLYDIAFHSLVLLTVYVSGAPLFR